ncbi:glutathione S-transferase T3-like [Brassica napus]|uniref:glutathione S-transferase T3-like n=1 Tax=Brassica napus TaxID=3708 RepID=UPI0006AAADC3|nr:glutathione S-transferase T3-like [Brassica napus]
MDPNLYKNLNFVDLLQSQQDSSGFESSAPPVFGTQATEGCNFEESSPAQPKERRSWSPTEDVVLISSWLNTSKDPVVGNEQRSVAFWKRIATYFNASPKLVGCEKRESSQCKQRWHKINDMVSKFCGAFEAATRERRSGQNENDVLKLAHEIFFANHKKKFTLEHAWKELRSDQKWSELSTAKTDGCSKKRKVGDASQSESSQAIETDDGRTSRPPGVKASKAIGKKAVVDGKDVAKYQTMWTIRKQDLEIKERMSKMKLLEKLYEKQEPLLEFEEALKLKLITELMSN